MIDLPLPIPAPGNEPVLLYAPGSPERAKLQVELQEVAGLCPTLEHRIDGKSVAIGDTFTIHAPHKHALTLAHVPNGGQEATQMAIGAALKAAPAWRNTPFEHRARVFLKAAELLAGPWRQRLNAATMLGQSKTCYQAEIDAACEFIDFLRFNVHYASQLIEQPQSVPSVRNLLEPRPLEGFVLAITPFNFTAIAGNLPTCVALMGNVVVWKPAENQSLAAHFTMQLLEEAGLPPGVINLVYGEGKPVADTCLAHPDLAGIHFTGSTAVFQHIWKEVGTNISRYRSYPRLVGETGGKDFVLAHPSADPQALLTALVRGAYEFQGQKCSAASRAYIPRTLWNQHQNKLAETIRSLKMGDVADFGNFLGAVINERAFTRLDSWLKRLNSDSDCKILAGGSSHGEQGFFIEPTLVEVSNPTHDVLGTELFGPVLSVFVYEDSAFDSVLGLINQTSPYALTGAIFSQDRTALHHAASELRFAAGNLYFNDKPTGAVVGQQPFGGSRGSGTNDKAGSPYNLLRWISPRTIKETFVPDLAHGHPHQLL
jgi:1-pyrroline-5-carboxylate dehydrogenase